jgi:hypothetical protein
LLAAASVRIVVVILGTSLAVACGGGGSAGSAAPGKDAGLEASPPPVDAGPKDASPASDAEAGTKGECLPTYATGAPPSATACPPAAGSPDTLDTLLGSVSLSRCWHMPSWESLFPDGPNDFRVPYFDALHDTPLWTPSYARALAADLDAAAASSRPVSRVLAAAAARIGVTLTACDPGASLEAPAGDTAPFAHAVEKLVSANGGTPDASTIEAQAAGIPMGLQQALVPIVSLLAQAPAVQKKYLGASGSEAAQLALLPFVSLPNGSYPPLSDATFQKAVAAMDTSVIGSYGAQLTMAIESADLARFAGLTGFSFSATTPLGAVVVGDAGAQVYVPTDPNLGGNVLLLVDTGGDDTYRVPVGGTNGQPAAVAIDLGGDDQYLYVEVPVASDKGLLPSDGAGRLPPQQGYGPASLSSIYRQGAGVLGVGLLYDYGGGKDHYRSLRVSQGFGAFGVGALYDDGGDDLYEGEAAVQASATFGLGVLVDAGGSDTRSAFTQSQGFGFTGGAAVLEDLAGDDQYLVDVGDPSLGGTPIYYSPQLPGTGNSSLSQGTGEGLRDDTDGLYWSGGLGMLRDVSGADVYTGSVFAQGTAYWFGIGLLSDGAGDDRYDALWYTQGSAAHGGLAFFADASGDDRYQQKWSPKSGNLGCGHDFGAGVFLDLAGNDALTGGGLSLGEGNDQGFGLFVDVGGTDVFSGTPGMATVDTTGSSFSTYGLFVKTGPLASDGGVDTINGNPASDAAPTTWRNPPAADAGALVGAGIDDPGGSVTFAGPDAGP